MLNKPARAKYGKLVDERDTFLEIARENALVTIPYLYPPEDMSKGDNLDKPYQSLGARGVNHLAASLLNILFPTDRPFFRLTFSEEEASEIDDGTLAQIDEKLAEIEKQIIRDFDTQALRSNIYNSIRLLLTGGTVALSHLDGNFRTLKLDQFVIKRKSNKTLDYIIIKDAITKERAREISPTVIANQDKKEYFLYTVQQYEEDGEVVVWQELEDEKLSKKTFKKAPIIVVVTNIIDGEDFGRSYVEELAGDLNTLELLSKAVAKTAALASKSIFMVSPDGLTRGRDVARANDGDVVAGRATDVTVLQSQKGQDLNIVFQQTQELKERLGKAFLLSTETFPDRQLTATEARARVQEVEASLGGLYSMLSQTLQLPFIQLIIQNLEEKQVIPELPTEVDLNIVTGMDLLDRRTKVTQINEFLQFLSMFGEMGMQYIDMLALIEEVARGIGLDPADFVREPEQTPMDPQAGMEEVVNAGVAGAAQGVGGGVGQGVQDMVMNQMAQLQGQQ